MSEPQTYTGQDGVVKVGSSPTIVGETTEFSIEATAGTVQATAQRAQWHKHKTGIKGWTGSATANFDISDTGQADLEIGSEVDLTLFPTGDAATRVQLAGKAIVTGRNISSPLEGMVTVAFSFQGTGALTESAVSGGGG